MKENNIKRKYPLISLIVWTFLLSISIYLSLESHEKHAIESEKNKAKMLLQQNLFLCHWSAMNGGLYVAEPGNETFDNPSLNISLKDVQKPPEKKFKLIYPNIIVNQLIEMSDKKYSIKINLLSGNCQTNHDSNDLWESASIKKLRTGSSEQYEIIKEKNVMRYMLPFIFKDSCLKCHSNNKYKTGEVIGGISVYYPLDDAMKILDQENRRAWLIYFFIWSGGAVIIFFFFFRLEKYIDKFRAEEKKLKESEELLWTLINSSPDIICFKDGECRWIKANDAILKLFQLENVDYFLKKDHELAICTSEAYQDMFRFCAETDQNTFNKGKIQRNTETIPTFAGETKIFDVIKVPLFNMDGSRKGIIVIGRDVTDEKIYEEKLKKQKEFISALLKALPVAIFYKDKDGRYLGCNRKYEELFSLKEKDIIGKTVFDMWKPDDAKKYHEKDIELMKEPNDVQTYEFRKEIKNKGFVDGIFYKSVLRDEKSDVAGIIGVFSDISELKEKEKELVKLASVIEQINDAVVLTDQEGKIEYVNPAFEKSTGYNDIDVLGSYIDDLVPIEINYKKIEEIWYIIAKGDVWIGQVSNRKKDGSLYEEELTVCPIKDKNDNITNYVVIKRDITDKKIMQFQLSQSQKMEALGRLASGIAHDFNNMLAVIQGNIELSKIKLGKENIIDKNLTTIENTINKGAGLIKQLLIFSRTQPLSFTAIDLNKVVLEMIDILKPLIGDNVKINTKLSDNLPAINGDTINLEQIIMNLSLNARDAMPAGGKITIKTEKLKIDEYDIRFLRTGKSGDYVVLSIEDTGAGMDHETLSRIFEPFFTTKEQGKGTGLGLYVVYAIIQQHNAVIEVRSELEKGTSFSIYFPACKDEEKFNDEIKKDIKELITAGNKRILLVEDEEKVRDVMRDILTISNYMVVEAHSFASAINIFNKEKDSIDMIITDFMLPDKNGFELLELCKMQKPLLKGIIVSGYLDLDEKYPEIEKKGYILFTKPFKANEFINFVGKIFHEGS